MADLSTFTDLSGNTYNLKDAAARDLLNGHSVGKNVPANAVFTDSSAYCGTSGSQAAKTATCTGYQARLNSWLYIVMAQANSYAGQITLNVNDRGAAPIYIDGAVSSPSNCTLQAGTYLVYLDSNGYHFRTDGKLPGYALIETDDTLETAGMPADAAAVGGAIETRRHETANLAFKTVPCRYLNTSASTPRLQKNASYTELLLLVFEVTPGMTYTVYKAPLSAVFRVGCGSASYEDIAASNGNISIDTQINASGTNQLTITVPDGCGYLYVQLWGRTSAEGGVTFTLADMLPSLRVVPRMMEMLPDPPSAAGTYTLTCTVGSAGVVYSWT